MPWVRFRLRTVLIVLSLFVLVLPVASIQVLRLYESALVRQTESALIAQTAFVAASFRSRFLDAADNIEAHSRLLTDPDYDSTARRRAVLDLADTKVLPPFPTPTAVSAGDGMATVVGTAMTPVLKDVQTRASIRITDHHGVVVASNGNAIGTNLSVAEEVSEALAGREVSRLREARGQERSSIATLVRGASIRVVVSGSIVVEDRVVGTVVATQIPSNILDALHTKRYLLLQATALLFAVVVATAIFTTRTLVRPIRRLVASAERIASGDAVEIDVGRYRTLELAQLAASVAAMAASLQQRTRYVRDLARSMSHEFKTPLAAMTGTLEVLADHLDDMTPAERRHFIDNLGGDVARLGNLTRRLLELARADMRDQATGDTTMAAAAAEPDRLDAAVDLDLRGVVDRVLPIDRSSLRAIVKIVADNAAEHGATRLRIDVGTDGEDTVVDITDDGTGIAPGDAPRIFEPFFTTRRGQGGTGLGLAIATAMLGNAGGTIDYLPTPKSGATTDAASPGATFRIRFPQSHSKHDPAAR